MLLENGTSGPEKGARRLHCVVGKRWLASRVEKRWREVERTVTLFGESTAVFLVRREWNDRTIAVNSLHLAELL